jgi:hypothetical protein
MPLEALPIDIEQLGDFWVARPSARWRGRDLTFRTGEFKAKNRMSVFQMIDQFYTEIELSASPPAPSPAPLAEPAPAKRVTPAPKRKRRVAKRKKLIIAKKVAEIT